MENEPLVPAETKFTLSTSSSLVADSSTTLELGINVRGNERYFDRPEVIRAYRAQEIIQTPEYTKIDSNALVGAGRLRPRNAEDVGFFPRLVLIYFQYSSH